MTGLPQGNSKGIKVQCKYNFKMLFISVLLSKNGKFYPRKLNFNSFWFLFLRQMYSDSKIHSKLHSKLSGEYTLLCQAMSAFVWLTRVYACICLIKSRVLLDPEF